LGFLRREIKPDHPGHEERGWKGARNKRHDDFKELTMMAAAKVHPRQIALSLDKYGHGPSLGMRKSEILGHNKA
jgi:hypothetical protein